MRRSTPISTVLGAFRAAFAGAMILAAAVSCDTYTTSVVATPEGVKRVHVASVDILLPDSLKQGSYVGISGNMMVPIGPVTKVLSAPSSPSATVAGACGGGGGASPEYSETRLPPDFIPEASPSNAAYARDVTEDGYFAQSIGFDFTFFGNTYNSVNVFSNGFLAFGTAPTNAPANGGFIPRSTVPNNIIALAWTDWSPQNVPDGIRFETRGTAPNRRFILQYDNVPEYHSTGVLMAQVVLSEGTNEITIYTNRLLTVNSGHLITQGIENSTGTSAFYDTFVNAANVQMPRVSNRFDLQSDGIRFTPISLQDKIAPTFTTPPVNVSQYNDPGLAVAAVAITPPVAQDNCSAVTVTFVRSDGLTSLDAPYHVGVTTITWTATDADGNSSTATQTVTVIDNESPIWDPSIASGIEVNATSPSGGVAYFDNLPVTDNVGVTSRSCEPASGSVFPLGPPTTVKCTASDAAGNSASLSFTVTVINAHDQIGNLIERVQALNLPDGTSEPIVNQLLAAYDQTADGSEACKKISDFMTMVQKKNSNISSGDAAYLLSEGTRILAVMGCDPWRPVVNGGPSRGTP